MASKITIYLDKEVEPSSEDWGDIESSVSDAIGKILECEFSSSSAFNGVGVNGVVFSVDDNGYD